MTMMTKVHSSNCEDCRSGVLVPVGYIDSNGVFEFSRATAIEGNKHLFQVFVCSLCGNTKQRAFERVLTMHKQIRRECLS